MTITTPCAGCAAQARLKHSAFFAARGLDWPLTTVAGRRFHRACAGEAASLVRNLVAGQLMIGPDGVARWATNGQAIPDDCAALYAALGLTPRLDEAATAAARDAETTAFLAAYRATQPAQASPEETAEMLAAFGPGATVVDAISGRVTQL